MASTIPTSVKKAPTSTTASSNSAAIMKFSVLMSVYKNDDPKYLVLALRSIYEDQSIKPNQIVLILDGPVTDAIEKVIAKFSADKKRIVELVRLKQNGGLGAALRVGSERCKYDYIMRMDADDISEPHRFEKTIKYLKAHPEIDVVGGYISEFEDTPSDKMRQRIVPKSHTAIVKMAKMRNPMNHMTVCIRKTALEKAGGYQPCPYLEDYYLWLRMITYNSKFANIPEVLVYARIGNGFTSRRSNKSQLAGRKAIQKYMLEHNLISRSESIRNMILAYALVYLPSGPKKLAYNVFLRKGRQK